MVSEKLQCVIKRRGCFKVRINITKLNNNDCCRNSLSIGMMEALIDNISEGQSNNELRVIVLEGEGPIFSAGHNLKELVC